MKKKNKKDKKKIWVVDRARGETVSWGTKAKCRHRGKSKRDD